MSKATVSLLRSNRWVDTSSIATQLAKLVEIQNNYCKFYMHLHNKVFLVASFLLCHEQVQQRVGYCPQFDALIEKLTVRETLTMYARLRGVPEPDINDVVTTLISKLLLEEYTQKRAGNLRFSIFAK